MSYTGALNIQSYINSGETTWDNALTRALAALPANGGAIYFPAGAYNPNTSSYLGAYKFANANSISGSVALYGDGPESSVIMTTNLTADTFDITGGGVTVEALSFQCSGTKSGGSYLNISGSNCTVSNIGMTGAYKGITITGAAATVENCYMNQFVSGATGITITQTTSALGSPLRLRNVVMNGPGTSASYGIVVTNTTDLNITDCDIDNMNFGLALIPGTSQTAANVRAVNTYFDGGSSVGETAGILISPSYGQTAGTGTVYNCTFTGCWASGAKSGVRVETSSATSGAAVGQIEFIGLQAIKNTSGSGISLGPVATGTTVSGITISGGLFSNNAFGIYVNPGVTDFSIQGVKAGAYPTANSNYGIAVSSGSPAANRYLITNNLVYGNTVGSVSDGGGPDKFVGSTTGAGANLA